MMEPPISPATDESDARTTAAFVTLSEHGEQVVLCEVHDMHIVLTPVFDDESPPIPSNYTVQGQFTGSLPTVVVTTPEMVRRREHWYWRLYWCVSARTCVSLRSIGATLARMWAARKADDRG